MLIGPEFWLISNMLKLMHRKHDCIFLFEAYAMSMLSKKSQYLSYSDNLNTDHLKTINIRLNVTFCLGGGNVSAVHFTRQINESTHHFASDGLHIHITQERERELHFKVSKF